MVNQITFINPERRYGFTNKSKISTNIVLIFITDNSDKIQKVLYNTGEKVEDLPEAEIKDITLILGESLHRGYGQDRAILKINVPNTLVKNGNTIGSPLVYNISDEEEWVDVEAWIDNSECKKLKEFIEESIYGITKYDIPESPEKEKDKEIKKLKAKVSDLEKTVDILKDDKEYKYKIKHDENGNIIW